MVQTKRKTNVVALAIVMSLVLVFAMAVALFAMPATVTAYAATSVIDSLSLANINAGNAEGKYGNFSWDNTKIKSISASEMTTDRANDPLCIVWTRPANGAYASALTFSVNITDSVGAITIRYDDSVPSYISPGEKQSGTLTETVNSLSSTYEKIYFYISYSYMYNDVHLTSVSIQIKATTYKMTFTKGTGIKEAYLSTDSNATSGSASGTEYAKYSTVYCFAKLAEGYKAQSGWTLIDGTANSEDAIYRVGTRSNISAAYNFGTINAVEKQKYLYRDLNGGGSISGIDLTYNQTADLSIPSRTGYTFLAWNTNAAGTGTTYGNSTDATLTAEQVNAIIADDSITYVYAQWEANEYNVIVNGDNQNLTYGSNFDLTPTMPEEGYTFRGYFDGENGTGTQYTDADGHSIRTWDKTEDDTHLYAYFTKDMAVVSVGYEADYDGEAHGITVNVTDPADGYIILYGEVEDSYTMEEITKTTAGTYTIYFKITKNGYNDYYGSAVIKLNKADAVLTAPIAKTGLHYTGVAQELVNAGSTTGGTIEYKLNDGEWSTAIPTATNVDDDYIVYYRVVGGTNFNDIAGVALSEAIEIEENDKTLLTFVIGHAEAYYDTIETEYPTVADDLFDAINEANAVLNNANKTEEEISTAVETLTGAVLNAQVGVVEEMIAAIPSPVTLDSEDEIIAAREAYDNLSDDQQTQVINRDALFAAEIDLAEALIADIGEVVYTTGCKGKIDKARDYFDGLDEDEQALIGEDVAQALEDAIAAYDKLATDNEAADAVIALINAIDDPVDYPESGDGIKAARDAYEALTEEQQALVDNYETLTNAENEYEAQKNAGVEDVEGLIDAIGEVKYPDSKDKIEEARGSYDALTDTQKAIVGNYSVLTTAEATYAELEAKSNKKLSGGAIAGIVIGCVAFVAIVCFLLWFFLFKKKKEDKDEPKVAVPESNDEPKNDQTDEPKE